MLLFIKDIPKYSTNQEVTRFISSGRSSLARFIPFISGFSVLKCEILRIEDKRQLTVEYHGLITVEPEKTGHALINRLDGAILNGRRVEVRPYFKRAAYKDRRRIHANLELLPAERRSRDRRRDYLHTLCLRCRSDLK